MKNIKKLLSLTLVVFGLSTAVNAGIISEDFSGGVFNNLNFEIGSAGGSASSGAWVSDSNRGTLRTKASDLNATTTSILRVDADVNFFGTQQIAFLGIRSTGLAGAFNEPTDSLFLRLHNFQNGHTGVAHSSPFNEIFRQDPLSGDAFWNDTVRVSLLDNGTTLDVSLQNLVTNEVNSFSVNSTFSAGGHVTFSSSGFSSWDNISISHVNIPEPASLAMLCLGLVGITLARPRPSLQVS